MDFIYEIFRNRPKIEIRLNFFFFSTDALFYAIIKCFCFSGGGN